MEFKYFKGPSDEMSDLVEEKVTCSICGTLDYCFSDEMSDLVEEKVTCSICGTLDYCFLLDYTYTDKFSDDEKEGKFGCVNCLKNGLFEFWHDTEFGMLDENGLTKVYKHNIENPPAIDINNLIELRRTPPIITWQQELWLTHCDDFMIYKGTWTPKHFNAHSKDGNGRQLFMEMTDADYNSLWDDSLEEGATVLEEWYPTYYVFECAHCGKLRGNWDCD